MATAKAQAVAKMVAGDCRPTLEVAVPAGVSISDVLAKSDWLVDLARKLGPRGCEMCLSGRDILIREEFEEIIQVALPGRG